MADLYKPGEGPFPTIWQWAIVPYQNFDHIKSNAHFWHVWHYSFYIGAIYLAIVYAVQLSGIIKKKHDIKLAMALWNLALAVFSLGGAYYVTWVLIDDLWNVGFEATVCRFTYERKSLTYWLYLMAMSKVAELFDTAFILLRKAPLQILHTYHHATVLIYSWSVLAYPSSAAVWYSGMNYLVHAIMYTYFCLRSINVPVPTRLAKCITSLQSVQMLAGFTVNFYSVYRNYIGEGCGNTYLHSFCWICLYFSYFVLFLRFAQKRYSKPKQQ